MKRLAACAVASVVAGASACAAAAPRAADLPLLVRGTVLAGPDLVELRDGAVLVSGDRILAVGPSRRFDRASAGAVIEVAGGFIVPALIDNHVHVLDRLAGREGDLARWLEEGVGTLVDSGSSLEGLHARQRGGETVRPRLLGSGPILTAPGGYPLLGSTGMPGLEVDEATAARRAAGLVRAGADLLKVAVEAGFLVSPGDEGSWPVLSHAALEAVVAVAHGAGLTVRAHVTQSAEMRLAFAAGVDVAAHTPIDPIPQDLLTRSIAEGRSLITTAALWREDPALQATVLENLRRWTAAGGRIALGTDAPAFHPGWTAPRLEIEALVRGALPGGTIVRAATVWGAVAAGRQGELGSLEPGARADLLVVPRDPRADPIALTQSIVVIAAGRVVRDARPGAGR